MTGEQITKLLASPTVVYRLYDASGELLYVGATARLARRLAEHLKRQPWGTEIDSVELAEFDNLAAASVAEAHAIADENPKHNHVGYVARTPGGVISRYANPRIPIRQLVSGMSAMPAQAR